MDTSQLYTSNTTGAMGEAAEGSSSSRRKRSREMESLSLEISKYPRDLLQRFMGSNQNLIQQTTAAKNEEREEDEDDDDDDDGLNLGLSLGGKFGVDKSHKRLIRASSVAGTIPLIREDDAVAPPPAAVQNLVRTSSLPSETEEEWRKRKELQTLRRMEAKRRRSEKQRSVKESGEERGGGGGAGGEVSSVNLNFRGRLEREQQYLGLTNRLSSPAMGLPFGSPTNWPGGSASGSGGKQGGSGGDVEIKGKRSTFGSLQGFLAKHQQQASQGSVESQGGTSSGEAHQGSSSYGDTRSPASSHSLQERGSQEGLGSLTHRVETESPSKQQDIAEHKKKEPAASGMEDMPSVFTIGDGPSGRKVEGILYKYGKGEEVRIMCVCHGSFFSPAEFVKHAGGKDVEHPLRHIVVNPSTSPFQ